MNKVVFATNNEHKLKEARDILDDIGIEVISQHDAGAYCEPEENGTTFAENAMIKANAVYNEVKIPVIADDSGLCVDSLNGRPGIYSARYAPKGQECDKLLNEMKNISKEKRTAHFQCVIAYVDADTSFTVDGRLDGYIGFEKRGDNGFGYDPVFMCGDRTLAEMTSEEKNRISHRSEALKEFVRQCLNRKVNENVDK